MGGNAFSTLVWSRGWAGLALELHNMSASGEDDKGVEATNTADGTCDMEVQKDATTESAEEDMDDFGDFEEGDAPSATDEREAHVDSNVTKHTSTSHVSSTLKQLPLSIDSNDISMREAIRELLPREFTSVHASMSDGSASDVVEEGMRQVEGLSQVLVSEQSRSMFRELDSKDMPSAPLDWRRSHTRRQYLISLGVPINLDEVLGNGPTKEALPPLQLNLVTSDHDSSSLSVPARPGVPKVSSKESWGDHRRRQIGLHEPSLPIGRIEKLLQLSEDDIKLLTLPELRELFREMESLSKRMGDALQYHLMIRETFSTDSEVYHGMIRDLVAGASNKVAARAKQEKRGFMGGRGSKNEDISRPGTPASR